MDGGAGCELGRREGSGSIRGLWGAGVRGIEPGAESVVFVERARGALKAIRDNAELLGAVPEVEIWSGDAMDYVSRLKAGSFDLALADPPYGKGFPARLIESFGMTPFASQLWVEHRKTDATPDSPGLRQRRYGDTLISIVEAKS